MRAVLWMLSTSTLLSISSVSTVANAKGLLGQCTSYHCLYKNIVKNRDKNYTEDACKSLDGKISRRPSNKDMGKLCRLYIARKKAGLRKEFRCRASGSISPDYNSKLSTHLLWIYSNSLYSGLPESFRPVKTLPTEDFNNKSEYNTFILSRRAKFKETARLKKITERKTRSGKILKPRVRKVTRGVVREVEFDVFYCVTADSPYRYIPYFYSLRITPSLKGIETVSQLQKMNMRKLSYVKMEYLKSPPLHDAKVLGQLTGAKLSHRYKDYKLIDFNNDGSVDLVFLEDVFRKYRPGVCLYQKNSRSCKVVMAKDYARSTIFFRSPHLVSIASQRIDIVVSDKQYKGNAEHFEYVFSNGQIVKAGAATNAKTGKKSKSSRKSSKRKSRKKKRRNRHSNRPRDRYHGENKNYHPPRNPDMYY